MTQMTQLRSELTRRGREAFLAGFSWQGGHSDVWTVLADQAAYRQIVEALAEPVVAAGASAVVGVESRGFLLGGAVALAAGVGFVPGRKGEGHFPGPKVSAPTQPDYQGRRHTLRMLRSSLATAHRVILVDDWIETGSQAVAVRELVEQLGSSWLGVSVVVDDIARPHPPQLGPLWSLVTSSELAS